MRYYKTSENLPPHSEYAIITKQKIESGDLSIIDDIEEKLKNSYVVDEEGFFTWIYYLVKYATHSNRNEMVERLIKNACPFSMKDFSETVDAEQYTVLMHAVQRYNERCDDTECEKQDFDLITLILKSGVDSNFKTPIGNSAFKIAQKNHNSGRKNDVMSLLGKYAASYPKNS